MSLDVFLAIASRKSSWMPADCQSAECTVLSSAHCIPLRRIDRQFEGERCAPAKPIAAHIQRSARLFATPHVLSRDAFSCALVCALQFPGAARGPLKDSPASTTRPWRSISLARSAPTALLKWNPCACVVISVKVSRSCCCSVSTPCAMTTIPISRAKLTMARIVAALSASVVERLMNDWAIFR